MVDRLLLVTGTGTEVGKTWVAARLLARLRDRGMRVAARKPVQSFAPGEGPTDAEVLAAATGERPDEVCPPHRSLPAPLAPPMAAQLLGRGPFTLAELAAELWWPPGTQMGVVEGVGGPRSPLASDGDTVDLARLLQPERVVLVADAGLGTINAVRLCLDALSAHRVTVVLNRFCAEDDLHRRNLEWLRQLSEVAVTVEELARTL